MPIVNDTNFLNKIPTSVDYAPWIQDSDGVAYSATMQQLANLFASLASQNLTVTVITAQQTLSTQQLVVASSGSAFDLDLPASSLNTGRRYHIYNEGAGDVTVTPNGSDTVGGAASLVLSQGESVIIVSDGLGNWTTFGAP